MFWNDSFHYEDRKVDDECTSPATTDTERPRWFETCAQQPCCHCVIQVSEGFVVQLCAQHIPTEVLFQTNFLSSSNPQLVSPLTWVIRQHFIPSPVSTRDFLICELHREGPELNDELHPNSLGGKISRAVNKGCRFGWVVKPFMGLADDARRLLRSVGCVVGGDVAETRLVPCRQTLGSRLAKPVSSSQVEFRHRLKAAPLWS